MKSIVYSRKENKMGKIKEKKRRWTNRLNGDEGKAYRSIWASIEELKPTPCAIRAFDTVKGIKYTLADYEVTAFGRNKLDKK